MLGEAPRHAGAEDGFAAGDGADVAANRPVVAADRV